MNKQTITHKAKLHIVVLTVLLSFAAFGQSNRYPIAQANLFGFIDQSGKLAIAPQFEFAGVFTEGLAVVRVNGRFGYIDTNGAFIIQPQYDYALAFEDGIAKVYVGDKPYFINRNGLITFQHNFKEITVFENRSYTDARTKSNKHCLIDRTGRLITDTAFAEISYLNNGIACVKSLKHAPKKNVYEIGAIDTNGKWIIPYGKYKNLTYDFKNGYAKAERFDKTEEPMSARYEIVDRNGKIKFTIPEGKYFLAYWYEGFEDGLAVIKMPARSRYDNENYHCGVINTDGKLLFSDSNWKEITPYAFRRAFVLDKQDRWKMINTQGVQVGDSTFQDLMNKPSSTVFETRFFTDGMAWVKLSSGWVKIDTSGKILTKPMVFEGIADSRLSRVRDLIVFGSDENIKVEDDLYLVGFWNSKTNVFVSPVYEYFRWPNHPTDLMYAEKDGNSLYMNAEGKVVWQENEQSDSLMYNLNTAMMNPAYFYVCNPVSEHYSVKDTRPIVDTLSIPVTFPSNAITVMVKPEIKDTMYGNIHAYAVFVGNTTNQKMGCYLDKCRLKMNVQALNPTGEWQDVEYFPKKQFIDESHDYNLGELPANTFWTFKTPVYEGAFKTKLRIALTYIDQTDSSYNTYGKREITMYSNEYEGSVNPGQFWNK